MGSGVQVARNGAKSDVTNRRALDRAVLQTPTSIHVQLVSVSDFK